MTKRNLKGAQHYNVTCKTIKAKLVALQQVVQKTAKPGTKGITRTFQHDGGTVTIKQTDPNRFLIDYDTQTEALYGWLVDGKVEVLWYKDHTLFAGTYVIGDRAKAYVERLVNTTLELLEATTPQGKLKADVIMVRDWIQATSRGTSGNCVKSIRDPLLNHVRYRVWTTKGGELLLVSYWSYDIHLKLTRKGNLELSYEGWDKRKLEPISYTPDQEAKLASKFLRKHFPRAFTENIIRVA